MIPKITFRLTDYFFDRLAIKHQVGKQKAAYLRNAGAYTQKVAQRSMRRVGKRGKPSRPGRPPKWHGSNEFSLRKILFGFDPSIGGVIVGPVIGNKKIVPTVPEVHEKGGVLPIREKRVGQHWVPRGRRKPRPGQPTRIRKAQFPPRPYMAPAVEKTARKFPDLYFGRLAAA